MVLAYSLAVGTFARDPLEFSRSFAHVANLVLTTLICLNVLFGQGREIGRSLAVFCVVASAAALVIVAQASSFNLMRDFRLSSLLGDFTPLGPGGQIDAPAASTALPRANGFYSEPSVAGWFMSFAVALGLGARALHPVLGTITAAVCSLGAMATLSLTGIIGPALVWLGYLVPVHDRWRFRAIAGLIAGSGIGAARHYAYQFGILTRFAHLETPGTSIYFRLTAPYRLISESLERFPFGYPLGQTDFIATRHYYINWEQGSQTNIDNTLLMIVFNFGQLGILFNAAYLLKAAQYLMLKRNAIGLVMLSLVIALCTTGAGWAHDVVLMIGYTILVGRYLLGHGLLKLPKLTIVWRQPIIPQRSTGPRARGAPQEARSLAA